MLADLRQRQQRRDCQDKGDQEHRAAGQQIAAVPITAAAVPLPSEAKRALRPSRSPIASGPTSPRLMAAIAGPSTQLATACRVAAATHHRKDRPHRVAERAEADGPDRDPATNRSERAASTMRATGHLPDQADDAADRQHESDLDLGPSLGGEVNRDERAEPGLHIGQKEDEPIQPPHALTARRGVRRRWRIAVVSARPFAIVAIDRLHGRARERGYLSTLFMITGHRIAVVEGRRMRRARRGGCPPCIQVLP